MTKRLTTLEGGLGRVAVGRLLMLFRLPLLCVSSAVLLTVPLIGLALSSTSARQTVTSPVLILLSFDGWRWDYQERFRTPNLQALAERGVRSLGLVPSFPTDTFPNHFTLVTGLLPDHHGVVANAMDDRTIGAERFTMGSKTRRDVRWWQGEPIWTTAMRQGRRAAAIYWPGADVIQPTYYKGNMDRAATVEQILEWLRLPEEARPSVVAAYFADVDSAGHRRGPDSAEVATAAENLDGALGLLLRGIESLGLTDRATIVVVSDHGMTTARTDRLIFLSDYITPDDIDVVASGATLFLKPAEGISVDMVYQKLAGKHPSLAMFKTAEMPERLLYGRNPRVPALVGLVEEGWTVVTERPEEPLPATPRVGGAHGYDPRYRDMHGLFVGAGPGLQRNLVVPEFESVHLYEFLCTILGLRRGPNDGDRARTAVFFAK